jgi:hypothetical protein
MLTITDRSLDAFSRDVFAGCFSRSACNGSLVRDPNNFHGCVSGGVEQEKEI